MIVFSENSLQSLHIREFCKENPMPFPSNTETRSPISSVRKWSLANTYKHRMPVFQWFWLGFLPHHSSTCFVPNISGLYYAEYSLVARRSLFAAVNDDRQTKKNGNNKFNYPRWYKLEDHHLVDIIHKTTEKIHAKKLLFARCLNYFNYNCEITIACRGSLKKYGSSWDFFFQR